MEPSENSRDPDERAGLDKMSLKCPMGGADVAGGGGGRETSWGEREKEKDGEDKRGTRSQEVYLPETSPVDYTTKCSYIVATAVEWMGLREGMDLERIKCPGRFVRGAIRTRGVSRCVDTKLNSSRTLCTMVIVGHLSSIRIVRPRLCSPCIHYILIWNRSTRVR